MIQDVGNIGLCELLYTEFKAQCKVCLSYWDVGRAPSREEARGQRIVHRQFAQEAVQKEEFLGYPRPIHTKRKVPLECV